MFESEEVLGGCVAVLEMVAELHARGYELLRIYPTLAPSGLHWRVTITAADSLDDVVSAPVRGPELSFSSAEWARPFGWETDGSLADAFEDRAVELAARSRGSDPAYRAWFSEVLVAARNGHLLYFAADWALDLSERIPLTGGETIRRPPE